MQTSKTQKLTESAILTAIATVLSLISLVKMPYGGDVTACSMAPMIILAYRNGLPTGLMAGFVYGVIQLLFGMNNLSYATSFSAAVAIILLDYIIAFTATGLSGIFRKSVKSQPGAMLLGTLFTCAIRYICHVISGCTVWAGVSIPTSDGLIYSLIYNSAYMLPETVVTAAAVWYLARVLDFSKPMITRAPAVTKTNPLCASLFAVGVLAPLGAVVYDAVIIFSSLWTEEGFNVTGFFSAPWRAVAVISAVGAAVGAVCFIIRKGINKG